MLKTCQFLLFLLPLCLVCCTSPQDEIPLNEETLRREHNSGGKAAHRPDELMPFFEKDLQAERVIADSNTIGQIVYNKIKTLFDDQSAPLESNIGGALLQRMRTGSYAPIHAEVDDGVDNDEVTISIRSIVLSGDPVLTKTLDGLHTKSRTKLDADGNPDETVTQDWVTMYTYTAVYKVSMLVEFDDQDGFSGEDKTEKFTIDFPVTVKRLSEWER